MGILFCILLWPYFTSAQSDGSEPVELEPIKVTAGSEVSAEPLDQLKPQAKSTGLSDEVELLPNFGFSGVSNRPRHFQIRGIGERGQFEHMQVNSVGVFLEGIDLSEEASGVPLGFGERVHASYGPQSLSWGGKALAGSLEVTEELTSLSFVEGQWGSFDTVMGRALFSTELASTDALFGASLLRSDGFFENTHFHKPRNKRAEGQILVSAQTPTPNYQFRQTHFFSSHDNGYDVWNFNSDLTTLSDHPGKDRHRVHGHSLQVTPLKGRPGLWTLTSVTHTEQLESYDEDWGNDRYWNEVPGWEQSYNYYAEFDRLRWKAHQKVGYLWSSGLEIGWHGSYFSEDQKAMSYQDEALRRDTETEISSESHGVWVEQQGEVGSVLLTAALRAEFQKVFFDGQNSNATERFENLAWRVQAMQEPRSQLLVNYLLQKGFRGGGFNTGSDLTLDQQSFDPEDLYHLEVSVAKFFASSEFMVRVFYYWHEDQQIQSSQQLDPTDPNTFTYFTDNVARSRVAGVEAGLKAEVGRHQWLSNLGLLESQFEEYSLEGNDLKGRSLSHAPGWTALTRWSWQIHNWNLYTQVHGRDSFYYSEEHSHKSPMTALTDIGVKYQQPKFQSELFVSNVFERKHYLRAYYFANEPPDWQPKLYEQPGAPRIWGLRLKWYL